MKRGMKLIVIDPRRTETALYADLYLQPGPGEDPTLAAGLLRLILTQGLEDRAFCERYVEGLETAEVARRLGIDAGTLRVRKHRALLRLAAIVGGGNVSGRAGTEGEA